MIRAITVKQPWAFLIIEGYKKIENRSRHCRIRERVAIHAAQKFDWDGYLWVKKNFPQIVMPEPHNFTTGAVVGSVEITDSVTEFKDPFYTGPIGWVMERPHPLANPVKWRGSQGWFKVPSLEGCKIRIPDRNVREMRRKREEQCRSARK